MKGDKAQTRPERRTPPLREAHEGRQMKGDKAQTRPERRTPPLRETHEGRQMKGDKAQTRPEMILRYFSICPIRIKIVVVTRIIMR